MVLAGILGASLGAVGACLQAFFRNPLAAPFTLGVSGGGTLGASVAIALGWGINLAGVPMVFLAAFAGSAAAALVVYRLSRTGNVVMPGTLLLAGVVVNLIASAGVILIQYIADYSRALQILRWTIGSIDIVGFDRIWRMLILLIPGWVVLMAIARDLHLLAMGEESAASLGVNVRRCERLVYARLLPDRGRGSGRGRNHCLRGTDHSPCGSPAVGAGRPAGPALFFSGGRRVLDVGRRRGPNGPDLG